MLSKTILAFAGLVAAAQAILVTAPAKDAKLDFSSAIKVEWTSVNTDPATFELVLVDQSNINSPIAVSKAVKTTDHEFTLDNFVAAPGTYKFNFLSEDPLNTGILAQSQTFTITKSGAPASESSSSDSATTTTTSKSSPSGTGAAGADSSSTTLTTKTSSGTPSKTSGATGPSGTGANASSSGTTPVKTDSAAVALNSKTFGIAGGLFAGLLMAL